MIRAVLLLAPLLLAACAAGGPAREAAQACAAEDVPIVTARVEPGEVVRHDLTMAEMRADALRVTETASGALTGGNPRLRHYFGQSLTKTRLDARVVAEEVALADGRRCAVPQRIDLVLRFVQREMRVAAETHGDACLEHEVETHELRHIALDDAMIERFRPVLEARARDVARQLRPTTGGSFEAAKAALAQQLRAQVRVLYEEFESQRHRRHRAEIDSAEEYARVKTMCEGRAHALALRQSY